jgi:hypothetical protein
LESENQNSPDYIHGSKGIKFVIGYKPCRGIYPENPIIKIDFARSRDRNLFRTRMKDYPNKTGMFLFQRQWHAPCFLQIIRGIAQRCRS